MKKKLIAAVLMLAVMAVLIQPLPTISRKNRARIFAAV